MFENLTATWKQLVEEGGPRQRLLDGHPLHLYFGADAASKAVFFLVTPERPQIPQMSSIVLVERGKRPDGTWTVILTLQNRAYTDAFMGMCIELARRSGEAEGANRSLELFFETLHQWKSLLSYQQTKRLSDEQIRGLVAELWFGLTYLREFCSPAEILTSWQGPYGAPQDYRMPDGRLYEVKSIHSGSRAVDISSVEQLDPPQGQWLALVLVSLDEIQLVSDGSVCLLELAERFRTLLDSDPKSLDELDHRFAALGFDPADEIYGEKFFAVAGPRFYEVTNDFPRILRETVPLAVDGLRYQLRLAGLTQYEINSVPISN